MFTAEQSKIPTHNHACVLGGIVGASSFKNEDLHGHGLAKPQVVEQAANLLHFGVPVRVRQGLGRQVHRSFPKVQGCMP